MNVYKPPLQKNLGAPSPHRSSGGPWRRFLSHPVWRQSLMSGLLCTVVVMTYALLGMIAFQLYYHFWFQVFLILFTPVWLVCYGLLFASRWKWHELVLGVFLALFPIAYFYLSGVEDTGYRLSSALSLSGGGVLAVSLGYWLARIGRSLFRTPTQKRPG
ncbi:hypothetical protein EV586_103714 [Tumebacillus sp. BK434]|uniref:hypothetical protein n=1 Tax=Tumebacillus sp. BK434 TaxID=2512169 RepID=UPI00104346A4|nr:hypothetical protein [Tumebacillus sp. BK434]TCP56054.1 hypothetical protein EV586_103714 [Tumebacillus sp. BK434]